jgi:hypothetical protein
MRQVNDSRCSGGCSAVSEGNIAGGRGSALTRARRAVSPVRVDSLAIFRGLWKCLVRAGRHENWDSALTRTRGTVNPVGLYSLARKPRKVAREYRRIVEEYSHLPISSTKFPILTS